MTWKPERGSGPLPKGAADRLKSCRNGLLTSYAGALGVAAAAAFVWRDAVAVPLAIAGVMLSVLTFLIFACHLKGGRP